MPDKAYVITGPTSGFGHRTTLNLAGHGTLVLVGRSPTKLAEVRQEVEKRGGKAIAVVCDLSDVASVRRAAAEIVDLGLPIAAVLNNAGILPTGPDTTTIGWDLAWATNHIGPFVFTEALAPHLADGTQIVVMVSAVEDPERKPATTAGFRGGRYLSAEASARGEWVPGGAKRAGLDAYATSKQAALATVFAFARENPRLRFNAIEPGFAPATNLGRSAPWILRALSKTLLNWLAPLIPYWTTPAIAGRMIAHVVTDTSATTGRYYNEKGRPMQGSTQVSDPQFQDRVVAETRALLANASA
jgi:NAD(P)-dependent dehydrogenase (short-subunit alcohol dehydrogenase family)